MVLSPHQRLLWLDHKSDICYKSLVSLGFLQG
jgi:hypothetical protein